MRRGLSIAGVFLLVGVLVLGLAGCTEPAPTRPAATSQAEATASAVQPQTIPATPLPGETVVTVFTPVAQTPQAGVTPTQDLAAPPPTGPTPAPTTGPAATSAPAPTAAPGSSDTPIYHVVQEGDTLSSIARRYGTTVEAIAEANDIDDPDSIYVGQRLIVSEGSDGSGSSQPPSGDCRVYHTVKQGEWIWQIARDYAVSPYDILEANNLTVESGEDIQPGQVLCIP